MVLAQFCNESDFVLRLVLGTGCHGHRAANVAKPKITLLNKSTGNSFKNRTVLYVPPAPMDGLVGNRRRKTAWIPK